MDEKELEGLCLAILSQLKNIAKEKGISNEGIGKKTGHLPNNVSRMFTGKSIPALKTLVKIAQALEVEITFKPISK